MPPAYAEDAPIWRHLSLGAFLAMLEHRTLHFTRLDLTTDPFVDFEDQSNWNAQTGMSEDAIRRSLDMMRIARQAVFVNCWYGSPPDSAKRWEGCGGRNNSVAIRSSVGALRRALKASAQKVYISNVQYIDFANASMPLGNAFLPALHKSHDLREEREVRALLLQTGAKAKLFSAGPDHGIEVSVDLADLTHEVQVPPQSNEWFCGMIGDIVKRYRAKSCAVVYSAPF